MSTKSKAFPKALQRAITNLLTLILANQHKKPDVFFQFSPHCELIDIWIHDDGWIPGAEADFYWRWHPGLSKNGFEAVAEITDHIQQLYDGDPKNQAARPRAQSEQLAAPTA